jgi:hypothetical protein
MMGMLLPPLMGLGGDASAGRRGYRVVRGRRGIGGRRCRRRGGRAWPGVPRLARRRRTSLEGSRHETSGPASLSRRLVADLGIERNRRGVRSGEPVAGTVDATGLEPVKLVASAGCGLRSSGSIRPSRSWGWRRLVTRIRTGTRRRAIGRGFATTVLVAGALLIPAGGAASAAAVSMQVVSSPSPDFLDVLSGIAVRSRSNAWAVGYESPMDRAGVRTLAEHWNGKSWSVVPTPNQYSGANRLMSVSVVPRTDEGWAVGDGYDTPPPPDYRASVEGLVEHWDGTAWHLVAIPAISEPQSNLQGVAAISTTNVWAVGDYTDAQGAVKTLIEHWDGSAWSVVSSPNPSGRTNILRSVAAVSPTDVWAAGTTENDTSGGFLPLLEHWDGSAWHVVSTPSLGSPAADLLSVGCHAGHVWAVGEFYDLSARATRTLTERLVSGVWHVVPSPSVGSSDNQLWAVAVAGDGVVWAVGQWYGSGNPAPFNTLVLRWNGKGWAIVSSPNPGSRNQLMGAAVSRHRLWAVGTSDNGNWRTLVERSSS